MGENGAHRLLPTLFSVSKISKFFHYSFCNIFLQLNYEKLVFAFSLYIPFVCENRWDFKKTSKESIKLYSDETWTKHNCVNTITKKKIKNNEKIISCLFVLSVLTSCTVSKYDGVDPIEEKCVKVNTQDMTLDIYKVNYCGHSYVMFDSNTSLNGVLHDPDCECHKKS